MKKKFVTTVKVITRITFLSLFLISFSTCSLLDSLDPNTHVRFKNNTSETLAGVRLDDGTAEYNKTLAPSAITDYMKGDGLNVGVEVKVGDTWTWVMEDGGLLSLSHGNNYTVTIGKTGDIYTASQTKD